MARGLGVFFLGAAYFALASATLILTRLGGGLALLWIAGALLIAWLHTQPLERWLVSAGACFLAGSIAGVMFGLGFPAAIPIAFAGIVEAVLAAWVLQRWLGNSRYFESAENIAIFVIVAGGLTPIITAYPAASAVSAATGSAYWTVWLQWVKAHSIGMICFTPIFVLLLSGEIRRSFRKSTTNQRLESVGLLAIVGLVSVGVFYQTRMPMLFVPILPMMAATVRLGRFGAAGSVIIVMIIGGLFTYIGHGPVRLIDGSPGDQLQFFYFYSAVTMLLLMPVAALLKHREELTDKLIEEEARYRLLADNATDGVFNISVDGTIRYASPSVRDLCGFEPAELVGTHARDLIADADYERVAQVHRQALAMPAQTFTVEYRGSMTVGASHWFEAKTRAVLDDAESVTGVVTAIRDISDRKALEFALGRARERAEEAALAKSAFLANMSHEIRTPMNGVVGFTELLLQGKLSAEQRRQVELIADSGRAMMRLLNDILDISKIDAGQMQIHAEAFDLPHAVRACLKLVTPAAEQKDIELRFKLAKDVPQFVLGDGLRLRQIMLNLLGNAVKFTDSGTVTVDVRMAETGDTSNIVLEVRDTGIGIPPERQAAIFEHFVQADSGVAARFGGTGLGLSISLRLAQLMGGDLSLESAVGEGTRFFLTLPLSATARPAAREKPSRTPRPAGPHLDDANVLVAEDHDVNQMLIAAMLQELGYRYEIVSDGSSAIASIETHINAGDPFTLVLMDLQMPGIDGLETTRRIRRSGIDAATLPIVALTANAFADDAEACLQAGMQAHIGKPVRMDELSAVLARWTSARAPNAAQGSTKPLLSDDLQTRYRQRRDEALVLLGDMIRRGAFAAQDLDALSDAMHKLAGSAGLFGQAALGEQAAVIEEGIHNWPPSQLPQRITEGYETLKRLA